MQRIPVESSLIASHGWEASAEDPTVGTLEVEFKAKGKSPASVYRYANVPASLWEEHSNADSKGSHFLKNIKGKAEYPHTKQPAEPAEPKES